MYKLKAVILGLLLTGFTAMAATSYWPIQSNIVSGVGDILYSISGNHLTNLEASTSGAILVANGVESAPSWSTGATISEVNRAADVSARIVTLTTNTSATAAVHEGKINLLSLAATAMAVTLPEATGSGGVYCFVIAVANTAEYEVQVATDDVMQGGIWHIDGDLQSTANAVFDWTTNTPDTINMDADTNTGGQPGDKVCVTDYATGLWAVEGALRSDGDAYSTVFSNDQS